MNQERLAHKALAAYPITAPKITFLHHNENRTFRVLDELTNNVYLLRIHSPLTTTFQGERLRPDGIVSELQWLEALAHETDLILQHPVRTHDGALVQTVVGDDGEDVACSLLSWIEGDLFPKNPSLEQVEQLGVVIETLHHHTRKWTLPDTFTRPIYDSAFYRRQINMLAMGVSDGIIKDKDFAIIQKTLEQILAMLEELKEATILIHADLHSGNLLVSDADIRPIDFSLCGFGYPLFDLGTCLPAIPPDLRSNLLAAYQRIESLPPEYPRLIDAFFLLSRMGAYVYMLPNQAVREWLKERIPRFTTQECQIFHAGKSLLFGGPF